MTAEKYINYIERTAISFITKRQALKAIEMSRKEEREKAIKAFVELSFVCTNCTEKCSVKCGQNCLMEKFIKILNK